MRSSIRAAAAAFLVLLSAVSAAQSPAAQSPVAQGSEEEWLPSQVQDGLAQQLAERMALIPMEQPPEEERVNAAREVVLLFKAQLEEWGTADVFDRSPSFPELAMPRAQHEYIDVMSRYQLCNAVLALQLPPHGDPEDLNLQFTGVMGMTAITMTILYLRLPMIEAGANDAQLESFATSPAMETVFEQLQQRPDLLAHAREQCTPVIVPFFENMG